MLKAVIFDMDGVLVDSEPLHKKSNEIFFEQLGIKLSKNLYSTFIGMSNGEMWSIIKKECNLEQSVEELIKKAQDLSYNYMEKNLTDTPIDGVLNLLEELKVNKIKIALASSSPLKLINLVTKRLRIKDYFDVILSGEEVQNGKPAPDIFIETARRLDVYPEECVVIEDSHNGLKGANKAKCKTIAYDSPNSPNQDLSIANGVVNNIQNINIEYLLDLFK
jgi:beta-phosphoglucomutase family hydrolase